LTEPRISRFEVTNLSSEDAVAVTLAEVAALFALFEPSDFFHRVHVLRAVADRRPFAVCRLPYTFEVFGSEFLPLCASLNLIEELEQLSHLHHVPPNTVQDVRNWYALRCF
jgi:hypothetical protein